MHINHMNKIGDMKFEVDACTEANSDSSSDSFDFWEKYRKMYACK